MKKITLFMLLASMLVISLSNCTEQEIKQRETTEYGSSLYLDSLQLNMTNPDVDIEARYPPGEEPGKTKIHISTNANPDGMTFSAIPEESEYWEAFGDKWEEMKSTITVQVAEENREEYRQIKVNPNGDQLTINVDDGAYVKTYPVNMRYFTTITFWTFVDPTNTEATLFLYDISKGSQDSPSVNISSDSDPTGFNMTTEYIDPMIYGHPAPFHNYTVDFYVTNSGQSNPSSKTLQVNEGEKIYVKYRDKTFYMTAFHEIHWPMPAQ